MNSDGQIAGVGGDVLGYNTYAYCQNNPVNMTDEGGNWGRVNKFIGGVLTAITGILAVSAAITASACVAPVALAVTAVAGVASMVFGAAEMTEAITNRNPVKEIVFNNNEQAYSMTKTVVTFTASMGTSSLASAVCFVAGTLISSEEGRTCIEDVEVGDNVWATNPETGETELKEVVQTFVSETNVLVHVYVNGEEIITTPGHPFYILNKGWVGADKLKRGDNVILFNYQRSSVQQVMIMYYKSPVKIYNLEVKDFHTYFVGRNSILVHNKGCGDLTRYSASQLDRIVGSNFHGSNGVKNEILKDVSADVLKKVGKNPDIALAKDGTIHLISTIKKGVSHATDLNINLYK